MILKIVKVGNYSPSINASQKGELIVPFYCVDEASRHITLKVKGTKPRFWSEEDPFKLDWARTERTSIGHSFVPSLLEQGYEKVGEENGEAIVERRNYGPKEKIQDVKDENFLMFGTSSKLWTVYVEYPFDVPIVRDALHEMGIKTAAADVPYTTAMRVFYGINTPYIEIPDERTIVNIKDVKSVDI